MKKTIILVFLFLTAFMALSVWSSAQSSPNDPDVFYQEVYSLDTVALDLPTQFIILLKDSTGAILPFKYLQQNKVVIEPRNERIKLPIQVTYKWLKEDLFEPYAFFTTDQIDSNIAFRAFSQNYLPSSNLNLTQDVDALNIQGVYGRSFTMGNQQDLSMEAAFNLQVSGYFLDSVKIEAAITDQHLPFQPEGNTQQIQEFDQLYIKLSKKRHEIIAGDFWLRLKPSHFMKAQKKVQGLYYELSPIKDSLAQWNHSLTTNFSVAKGTFTRNELVTQDGNQGPYKLKGAHGELFFIILSGSEKVYIDGQLQVRGEDHDYIIDYNSSEVMFMPQRPITKDSRVIVEFEYQDRNYLNTLWYGAYEAKYKNKWKIGVQIYSNQDAKNQPYQQDFTPEQKLFLKNTADEDVNHIYFPSWREDTLAHQSVSYVLMDSVVDQQRYDSIWKYNPQSEAQQYQVIFTHFGPNGGHYNLSMQAGNGKIFEWVAPVNGVPQGEYEPVMPLIAPKMHQLLSVYSEYAFNEQHQISAEWSSSHYDANLYNKTNWRTQTHHAAQLSYIGKNEWNKDSMQVPTHSLYRKLNVQMIDRLYKPLEPFQEIEFQRNWNLSSLDSTYSKEWLMGIEIGYRSPRWKKMEFENLSLSRDFENVNNRTSINALYEYKKWLVGLNSSVLIQKEEGNTAINTFFKPKIELIYFFEKDRYQKFLGATYYSEQLNQRIHPSLLSSLPVYFHEFRVFKEFNFHNWRSKLQYKWRQNHQRDFNHTLLKDSESQELSWEWALVDWKDQHLNFISTYRWMQYFQTPPAGANAQERNVLGRIQYEGSLLKNIIQQQVNFDFGSGQEQKKSFIYIKVPPGQGQYMWVDYNGDAIQQANEFELAIYEDQKEYIRILTPTNDFVKVNYMQFHYQLQVRPDQWFKNRAQNGWRKWLAMTSNRLQIQVHNRMQSEEGLKTYWPFYFPKNIEHLVNRTAFWNNVFSINAPNKKWMADWQINQSNHQVLMYYGLEQNEQNVQTFRIRWNVHSDWRLAMQYSPSYKSFHASEEALRNYTSHSNAWEPEITYTLSSFMRWSLAYKFQDKFNSTVNEDFTSQSHHLQLTGRLSKHEWGFINTKIEWVHLNAKNNLSGPLNYIIMEGLEDGNNLIWNLQWERTIGKGMNFSLFYEGRTVPHRPTIHSGRVTLRALL